ncbi:hypothetical protein B0T24DRAFT_536619, partial [Lasiosphaeria ovina]
LKNPSSTNEEVRFTIKIYIKVVAELIKNRVKSRRVDTLGGREAIDYFKRLVKEGLSLI